MRVGAGIYEHTDGRWEARYRKGRKPDGTIICGSAYGRSYEEAEKKRAELLHALALKAETSVAKGTSIRRGSIIMPQATGNAGAKIGDFCIIASNTLIGFNATVENYAHCDCAYVGVKGCTVPELTTVESGEIVKDTQKTS